MTTLECFFDCSSPWTYLAFHNLQPLAAELDIPIKWRPILVGGIFNAVNRTVYESRANSTSPKIRHIPKDLADWARFSGLALRYPPSVFPVNSVKAMRACLLLEAKGKLVPFARVIFEMYFGEDRDVSQDAVLTEACTRVAVDPSWVLSEIAKPALKDKLRANGDELIQRGGFGSPTIFVNGDDMYFGNDRLVLVRDALQTKSKTSKEKNT